MLLKLIQIRKKYLAHMLQVQAMLIDSQIDQLLKHNIQIAQFK